MSSVCKDDIKLIQTLRFYLQKPKYKCSSDTRLEKRKDIVNVRLKKVFPQLLMCLDGRN